MTSSCITAATQIQNAKIVELPIVDSMHPRPDFMPLAIPQDLAPRLLRLHGDPPVWWIGQFVKYLTRPQPHLKEDMERTKKALNFKSPIVGYVYGEFITNVFSLRLL